MAARWKQFRVQNTEHMSVKEIISLTSSGRSNADISYASAMIEKLACLPVQGIPSGYWNDDCWDSPTHKFLAIQFCKIFHKMHGYMMMAQLPELEFQARHIELSKDQVDLWNVFMQSGMSIDVNTGIRVHLYDIKCFFCDKYRGLETLFGMLSFFTCMENA